MRKLSRKITNGKRFPCPINLIKKLDRDNLARQQGWNDRTMLVLSEDFIEDMGLWSLYEAYLNKRAGEEFNGRA